MQIAGTTAIVTGAASGLGRATAELLASAGAKVAGFDIAVVRTPEWTMTASCATPAT